MQNLLVERKRDQVRDAALRLDGTTLSVTGIALTADATRRRKAWSTGLTVMLLVSVPAALGAAFALSMAPGMDPSDSMINIVASFAAWGVIWLLISAGFTLWVKSLWRDSSERYLLEVPVQQVRIETRHPTTWPTVIALFLLTGGLFGMIALISNLVYGKNQVHLWMGPSKFHFKAQDKFVATEMESLVASAQVGSAFAAGPPPPPAVEMA